MTDLASLAQQQPQANPQQAALAGLLQQQRPVPTHAQVVAGLHRFSEIEQRAKKLLEDPEIGKKNIRPKVLDMGADLIGNQTITLPQFMDGLKSFPSAEDLLGQKAWVKKLYDTSVGGQISLLDDRARAEGQDDSQWTPDSHQDHMSALLAQYPAQGK